MPFSTRPLLSFTFPLWLLGMLLLISAAASHADQVCSSPGSTIPNGSGTLYDTIHISDGGIIADLNVSVDISIPEVEDLVVVLRHIDTGTFVTLLQHPGFPPPGCSEPDIDAVFEDNDDANTAAHSMCSSSGAAIQGSVRPYDNLKGFYGEYMTGNWQLIIQDSEGGGTAGVLNEWCLEWPEIDGDRCFNFSSGIDIPDNDPGGVISGVNIEASGSSQVIGDLDVSVLIDHSWVGDLSLSIQRSTDPAVVLLDRPGRTDSGFGCPSNDIAAKFDDETNSPAEDECETASPTIAGRVGPTEALDVFDGQDFPAIWVLRAEDHAGGQTGTIYKWCLSRKVQTDLEITTTVSQDPITDVSGYVTYQIEVVNNGPADTENVVLMNYKPTGFSYFAYSGSHGGVSSTGWEERANIGDLAVGEKANYSLVYSINIPPTERTVLEINSPSELMGELPIFMDLGDPLDGEPPITADIVRVTDGSSAASGTTHDGCQAFTNASAIDGKIAFMDMGGCSNSTKYTNAIDAGAAAIVMGDRGSDFDFRFGAAEMFPTIPTVRLRKLEADRLRNALSGGGVNATMFFGEPRSVFLARNSSYVFSDTVDPDFGDQYGEDDHSIASTLVRLDTDSLTTSGMCIPGFGDCLNDGLRPSACAGANGFLGQINIASVVNLMATDLEIDLRYVDLQGVVRGEISTTIGANLKRDFIVNDLGLQPDSVGSVCVETNASTLGAWAGGVTIYKPDFRYGNPVFGEAFDFALYYPFANPKTGHTTVPLNTFHLGTNPAAVVANWISISDAERGDGKGLRGRLRFMNDAGDEVGDTRVSIPDGGRMDFSGHEGLTGQTNADAVGMARFVPEDSSAEYYLTLTRYFYDCPGVGCNNFLTAFNIPDRPGIDEIITSGVSTVNDEISIIELNNVSDRDVRANISVRDTYGGDAGTPDVDVPPLGTRHVIVNKVGDTGYLEAGMPGAAQVSTSSSNISALAIHYRLSPYGELLYAYAAPFMASPGDVQISEFNSFISHNNSVELYNSTNQTLQTNIDIIDVDGNNVFSDVFDLPAFATRRYQSLTLPVNTYGTINIQAASSGLLVRNHVSRDERYTLTFNGK